MSCLFKGSHHGFHAQAINLDVHLDTADTIAGTGNLEVHVTKMIFITKDVCKDCVFTISSSCDQSHGNATHVFWNGNTCIHQGQRSGTNSCH